LWQASDLLPRFDSVSDLTLHLPCDALWWRKALQFMHARCPLVIRLELFGPSVCTSSFSRQEVLIVPQALKEQLAYLCIEGTMVVPACQTQTSRSCTFASVNASAWPWPE
jgi:hypothetical protein